MLTLLAAVLVILVLALAVGIPLHRRRQKVLRRRKREKDQAYVARLRAKWDEKHSEDAEAFVERQRPWDGTERRKPWNGRERRQTNREADGDA